MYQLKWKARAFSERLVRGLPSPSPSATYTYTQARTATETPTVGSIRVQSTDYTRRAQQEMCVCVFGG